MQILPRFLAEFARAMRNFQYEKTINGLYFPKQKIVMGGIFGHSVDGSPMVSDHNTAALEGLDAILSCYFNNGAPPPGFYIAPFTNNVAPSSALTAATFAETQGEYTGYTQPTRVQWVPNGNSAAQTMSNSVAVATFTVGAAAVTITGAGMIANAPAKSAVAGELTAAALFGIANSLNPGSTLQVQYNFAAMPAD
ncbi:MAG: hypothetical protein WA777_12680 [Rhodanobacter sp.]